MLEMQKHVLNGDITTRSGIDNSNGNVILLLTVPQTFILLRFLHDCQIHYA